MEKTLVEPIDPAALLKVDESVPRLVFGLFWQIIEPLLYVLATRWGNVAVERPFDLLKSHSITKTRYTKNNMS